MLRTLGGRNIGKCRLRAHHHPLLPPLSNQRSHKLPPTYLQSDSSNERVLKMYCCMHRFLISGSDLRIDARFGLFTPSFVHRFLISGSDLGIDAGFCLFTPSSVHRFLISSPDLGIDARFHPIMPCCMHRFLISRPDLGIDAAENSFACSSRCGSDLPHPILIFVAAKENGPPAATAAATIFRVRF